MRVVIGEDIVQFGSLRVARFIDAVEAFGVAAGIVVKLPGRVVDGEFVSDRSGLHGRQNLLRGLTVLVRHLEVKVPEPGRAGAEILRLFPGEDSVFVVTAAAGGFVSDVGLKSDSGEGLRIVAQHQGMAAGGVLEEIEDAFLLH